MRVLSAFLLILIVASSCSGDGDASLKRYYFQYKEFTTPKVYKFVDRNKPDRISYWHMKTEVKGEDTLFTTENYDGDFLLLEKMVEKITPDGAVLLEYCVYNDDIEQKCKKTDVDVFKWDQSEEEEITWSISYLTPYGIESISKSRFYKGEDKSIKFGGEKIPTVRFRDDYKINPAGSGAKNTVRFHQNSFYGEGIGILRYKRFLDDELTVDFELEEILSEKEWKNLKGK